MQLFINLLKHKIEILVNLLSAYLVDTPSLLPLLLFLGSCNAEQFVGFFE